MKDFDLRVKRKFNDVEIEYGILQGNSNILFIKPGLNGSLYGYNNKYLTIANLINQKYGSTVICSTNPHGNKKFNQLDDAIIFIDEYTKEENINNYKIYYMGNSNGGMIACKKAHLYPQIDKMLIINAPLMFNCDLITSGLKKFDQTSVSLIYGSLDPSINNIGLFDYLDNKKVTYYIIYGQDHNFSNDMNEFIQLAEKYLYKK